MNVVGVIPYSVMKSLYHYGDQIPDLSNHSTSASSLKFGASQWLPLTEAWVFSAGTPRSANACPPRRPFVVRCPTRTVGHDNPPPSPLEWDQAKDWVL